MAKKWTGLVVSLFVILAGILGSSRIVQAVGADEGTGSITITNGQSGVDYAAYQIFSASYSVNEGSGQTEGVTYFADEATKNIFESWKNDGVHVNPFVFTSVGNGRYAVTLREGYPDDVVVQFFNYYQDEIEQKFADRRHAPTTIQAPTIVFDNLPYGYYFVTTSSNAAVTLTTAAPKAQIIEKTQRPVIDENAKKVKAGDEWVDWTGTTVGDIRDFKVQYSASNYVNETAIREYNIRDAGTNLEIDETSLVLTIGTKVIPHDQFAAESIVCSVENGVLTMTIPWVDEEGNPLYLPAPVDVTLTYSARVLGPAATQGASNTVEISYAGTTVSSTVNLATYYFRLNKYDKTSFENGSPVQVDGAQFTLWDAAENGNRIYVEPNGTGGYNVVGKGEAYANDVLIEAGLTSIYGLNEGTYYLQEEKAPDGYNRLTTRAAVQVQKPDAADSVNTANVLNAKGALLPGTGEGGYGWLFETALLLSGLGVILLLWKRHKDRLAQH